MDTSPLNNTAMQCNLCRHHIKGCDRCSAFPDGIPDRILCGDHDYTQPFPGDRDIRFECLERPGTV